MSKQDRAGKITVEKLLRLKRNERPSDEFWNRFEAELEEKTLQALVAQPNLAERVQRVVRRAALWLVPATGVAMGAFALLTRPGMDTSEAINEPTVAVAPLAPVSAPPLISSREAEFAAAAPGSSDLRLESASQFAVDVLSPGRAADTKHFRRVLYTPSFSLERAGDSRYAADPISAHHGALVYPAALGSGRNF